MGARRRDLASFLVSGGGWPFLLTPLIPAAVVLEAAGASPVAVFVASALGVIPTAALMGRATEELAVRSGPGVGSLLNVTFGNAPELIIALFALGKGLHEVVKASLVGSMLGNVLLVLGAAIVAGGVRRREGLRFDRRAALAQAGLLALCVLALVAPAIVRLAEGRSLPGAHAERVAFGPGLEWLSLGIALVLMVCYAGGTTFSLRRHGDLHELARQPEPEPEPEREPWSVARSVGLLALAGVAVGVMSEVLVGSVAQTARSAGLSQFFIGVIVVAIVGNAAEHWVAVLVAARDKMDLALGIALGSSVQIGLLAVPLLVVASFVVGPGPLALVLNPFELVGLAVAAAIGCLVAARGRVSWPLGALALTAYAAFAVAFALA